MFHRLRGGPASALASVALTSFAVAGPARAQPLSCVLEHTTTAATGQGATTETTGTLADGVGLLTLEGGLRAVDSAGNNMRMTAELARSQDGGVALQLGDYCGAVFTATKYPPGTDQIDAKLSYGADASGTWLSLHLTCAPEPGAADDAYQICVADCDELPFGPARTACIRECGPQPSN